MTSERGRVSRSTDLAPRCLCRRPGDDYRRIGLDRLRDRSASRLVWGRGLARRQHDPGLWRQSRQYRRYPRSGDGQYRRYPRRICVAALARRPGLPLQPSGADQSSRFDVVAGRRPRDQLHGATSALGSMPGGQSRDRNRACRDAADLWPARISPGRRTPSAAPGRRERGQQDGGRGLSPLVSRCLRHQDALPAADQCLRARNAHQGCPPDLPRYLAAPGHRRRAVRGLGRRAAARPSLCR